MNQPFTIDGKSYQPGENKRFFSGDGWRLHCSSDGSVTLTLTNYDGGAINIPTAELAVWLWGKNYINGSTNGPALCGAGELVLCAELRPRPKFAQRADHHGRQRTERHLGEADPVGRAHHAERRYGRDRGVSGGRGSEHALLQPVRWGWQRTDRGLQHRPVPEGHADLCHGHAQRQRWRCGEQQDDADKTVRKRRCRSEPRETFQKERQPISWR